MEEKRRNTRIHTVHLVSYRKLTGENLSELMGMGNTVDLSEGGIKLMTKEPLAPGDTLRLDLTIEGKVIRTDATVKYVQEVKHYHVGFEFGGGLSPEDAGKVRDYIAKHGFKDKSKE